MLRIFVLVLLALPAAALSQTGHEHHSKPAKHVATAPAAAPRTTAPVAKAQSVTRIERYQRFTPDEPLKDWREVNDTVRNIGGWKAYAQEAARAQQHEKAAKEKKP